jgi:hypothetical protein
MERVPRCVVAYLSAYSPSAGGMHGGHYTALSRVEEVAAQDLASLRAYAQSHPLAPSTSSAGSSEGSGGGSVGGALPLSLQEFISTHFTSGSGAAA